MVQNRMLKFRVTAEQLRDIKSEAQAKGYIKVAPYLRDLALSRRKLIEDKITETHKMVNKIWEVLENEKGRKV